jgi:hypothetical protein
MQNDSKKIYLHTLETPVYFQTGAFSGFLAKYVFKLDGFDKVIGLNPVFIKNDKRLPGIGTVVKLLMDEDNQKKKTVISRELPGDLKDKSFVSFDVTEEIWNLFLKLVKDD